MQKYAYNILQLYQQLEEEKYSLFDQVMIKNAYQFALKIFAGRYHPSGVPFIHHVIRAASILVSMKQSIAIVCAGMLHNVYRNGDFGDGIERITFYKRWVVRKTLGTEVENIVWMFSQMKFDKEKIQKYLKNFEKLSDLEKKTLIVRLADQVEHFKSKEALYRDNYQYHLMLEKVVRPVYIQLAKKLGFDQLSLELEEEYLKKKPQKTGRRYSYLVPPRGYRKRLPTQILSLTKKSVHQLRLFKKRVKQWRASHKKGFLEVIDPQFKNLFKNDIEKVASGFKFTEGPVWSDLHGCMFFSDIPGDKIYQLSSEGNVSIFREKSGNSNGLTFDQEGNMITCEHKNRRVTKTTTDGNISVLADQYSCLRLNSPNDVVVNQEGKIYFTDPPFGIDLHEQEQPHQGVYRLDQKLHLVAGDMERPNGLAFSPDEKKLYVSNSMEHRHLRVYDVLPNGELSNGRVFCDMKSHKQGSPDGLKVDQEGRVFCTGPGGVWVINPVGKHLGTIVTPEQPSNCAWGDKDKKSLYITAVTSVYRIRLS